MLPSRRGQSNFPEDAQAIVAIQLPLSPIRNFNIDHHSVDRSPILQVQNVRVGDPVTLQGVGNSFDRAIPFDRQIFPSAVPAGERGRTSVTDECGTIWTHSDVDEVARGARQRSTAQRRFCNSDAGNITATSRADSKRL